MTKPALALAFGLAVATSTTAPAAAAPDETAASPAPRLSGHWQLDKEHSEDARAKMSEARGGERPRGYGRGGGSGGGMGGGGHWGGGRGGGMRGGQHGEGPDAGGDEHGRMPAFRDFFEPPQSLEISQDEQEVTIDGGDGRVLRLHPDGRKSKSDGGDAEVKARWNGSELVAESKLHNGAKLTNVYALAAEGHELHVTSRLDGRSGEPITVRRVYAVASPAPGAP